MDVQETAISLSSTEAEIVSLDAGPRKRCLLELFLGSCCSRVRAFRREGQP